MSGFDGIQVRRAIGRFGMTRCGALALLAIMTVLGSAAWFGSSMPTAHAGAAVAPARKCVAVFVAEGDRRPIGADAKALEVIGAVPCAERGVMSWAPKGVYRAFDDGTVEQLASPLPPCPEGDAYVWIRYPNPTS